MSDAAAGPPPAPQAAPPARVFRLPKSTYISVLFLVFGAFVVAFGDNSAHDLDQSSHGIGVSGVIWSWRLIAFLVPLGAAAFIARTATVVSPSGIRIRAIFGSRTMAWDQLRGLSVSGHTVYAVLPDGLIRLPCVRVAALGAVSRASGGRLSELPDPKPQAAPSRRR